MNFVSSRPDVVRSVNQRWLLQNWLYSQRDNRAPSWEKLDVQALARMTDTLAFFDVVDTDEVPRFLVRFNGKRICQAFGHDSKDRFLDETLTEPLRAALMTSYRQAVSGGLPVYTICNVRDRQQRLVHYERLLLPFSSEGTRVDRILGSYEFVSLEGAFDNHDLLKEPLEAPRFELSAAIDPVANATVRKTG